MTTGSGKPKQGFRLTAKRKALIAAGKLDIADLILEARAKGFDPDLASIFGKKPKGRPKKRDQQGIPTTARLSVKIEPQNLPAASLETDEQIIKRLDERFATIRLMVQEAANGSIPSLIISGPAGLGKSWTVEEEIKAADPNSVNTTLISGNAKATGVFKTLYKHRFPGQVVLFDDCDSIFGDETSLNILKAVCDTKPKRTVSWKSEVKFVDDDDGTDVPKTFEFEGTVIFISNYSFDAMAESNSKLSPHIKALLSRSLYVELVLNSKRDAIVWIRHQCLDKKILAADVNDETAKEVADFIETNVDKVRELSLRTAVKIAYLAKKSPNWRTTAEITCCRS